MSPIESKIFNDHAEQNLSKDLSDSWQGLGIDSHLVLLQHNITNNESWGGNEVEEEESLEGLLELDLPFGGVRLPWPGILKHAISLKEGGFGLVDEIHDYVAEGEDAEMSTPTNQNIDLTISEVFLEVFQARLEDDGNKIEKAESD